MAPIKSNQIPAGFKCPGGWAPIAGLCFMPFAGSASSPDPRCVTPNTTKCVDITPKADGRVYNLAVVVAQSQIPTAQRGHGAVPDSRSTPTSASRARAPSIASTRTRPAPTTCRIRRAPAPPASARRTTTPRRSAASPTADPCSVGLRRSRSGQGLPGHRPSGSTQPAAEGAGRQRHPALHAGRRIRIWRSRTCWPRPAPRPLYPLARRLYFATIYGFGNLLGGEKELAQCMATNSISEAGASRQQGLRRHLRAACSASTTRRRPGTATPAPNVQGPGNVALGGCGSAGNTDACAASPITIQ